MKHHRLYLNKLLCLSLLFFFSCNEWDEHNAVREEALNENLFQAISKKPELSKFAEYLVSTGYDAVISSSKSFTVWAPTNEALEGLDTDIVNDAQRLAGFVSHHISNQEYFTTTPKPIARIGMLSGKYLNFNGISLQDIPLVSADFYVRNGVLHTINTPVLPKQNTWELMIGSSLGQTQASYIQSLTYQEFVDSLATQIGVDPATGKPIYQEGTGIVVRNRFNDEVYNLGNEEKMYTTIVMTDDAFKVELDSITKYFKTVTNNADSTNKLASWHLVKDLVIEGLYLPEELPATLISKFNVKVPIDKSAIVETHFTSNGIVYIMSKVDFRFKDKFPPIVIEGENPNGFSRTDRGVNIHYRLKSWAQGGLDLRIRNHGVAQFYARYKINNLYSTNYKVSWRTVNDFVDTTVVANRNAFVQKLVIDTKDFYIPSTPVVLVKRDFGYVKVVSIKTNPANNKPRYLGDYNHSIYSPVYLFMIANNVNSPQELNAIELDYLVLEPQP